MSSMDPHVLAFLEEPRFATLATINRDGSVQQSVMWYLVDGDHIMMNTARGRLKDKNLINDPRASICVEDGYRYVSIIGEIAMIDDQSVAQPDIKRLAARYHGAEKAEEMMKESFGTQERVTLRMSINRVSANGF